MARSKSQVPDNRPNLVHANYSLHLEWPTAILLTASVKNPGAECPGV